MKVIYLVCLGHVSLKDNLGEGEWVILEVSVLMMSVFQECFKDMYIYDLCIYFCFSLWWLWPLVSVGFCNRAGSETCSGLRA